MEVTYNGYTGALWKFERKPGRVDGKVVCGITILCKDGAKVNFENAFLGDIRFSGANITFGD